MKNKIAILCHNFDLKALKVINYFIENKYPIEAIIIENNKTKNKIKKPNVITWKLLKKRYDPPYFLKIISRILFYLSLEGLFPIYPEFKLFKTLSVKKAAKKNNINCYIVNNHSAKETETILKKHLINYALLVSSKYLIKDPLLSIRTKIINAHCGMLPKHRSLDSLPWSIMDNDPVGITTHFVDEGIDTGDILLFKEIKPDYNDDLISLRNKVDNCIPKILYDTIIELNSNKIIPVKQNINDGIRHRPMTLEEFNKANEILKEKRNSENKIFNNYINKKNYDGT